MKQFPQKNHKSIIYVNFSPYQNTGKILDFLLDNYKDVFLYSFNFHSLGANQEMSKLKIYQQKKLTHEHPIIQIPVPKSFIFLFLPLRSLLIFLEIIILSIKYKPKGTIFDTYFTVNAFTAWIGNTMKSLGLVKQTIFWVWDYYPPLHDNKIIMLMRWLYWQFDKLSIASDKVIFLNKRLENLHKDIGVLPKLSENKIVPIGTNPLPPASRTIKNNIVLGCLGVLKKSQGLDLIFAHSNEIHQLFPEARLEIIGSGPDEEYFRSQAAKNLLPTKFHGYIIKDADVEKIVSKWHIGLAPYVPEESNVSYYGDPSKIKMYLSAGLPVITTNVFMFSEELETAKAGIIINYFKPDTLLAAIKKIKHSYRTYRKNARHLGEKYAYQRIYPQIFD